MKGKCQQSKGSSVSAASIVEIVFFIPSHSVWIYLMIIGSDDFSIIRGSIVIVGDNMERKSMSYYHRLALSNNSEECCYCW